MVGGLRAVPGDESPALPCGSQTPLSTKPELVASTYLFSGKAARGDPVIPSFIDPKVVAYPVASSAILHAISTESQIKGATAILA